ncbi:kinesin-like protein KIF16B isoform X6 [Rissa tridactyla]|uniref:kinesin-like protein KIF16B isoform X6 n=1 Tax=Rissa tridactyla TaxID=75485 RepID=UPI0023BABB5A|nr:kinesin-like protein KIF16B isoform X6 [Rissa tridactyla]
MASVKVAVRVRPMNRREKDLNAKFIISMEKNKTTITNLKVPEGGTGDTGRERTKTFTYDFSYFSADSKSPSFVCQEMVFKNLGTDVLKSAFEGYNACVFAYGQTGSGKSYTMMGNAGDAGLIPRICEGLFSKISEKTKRNEASFRTEVSYLEIYNERVRDLLRRKSSKTTNLRIREHPKEGPYVEDLSKHLVQNYTDVEELMDAGNINRTTAATGMNDVSSRSHAIFTINFTQAKFDSEMPCETVSKIHLVDLAGSERADATGATGVRLKEGGNINKSLVTLGNVISALADLSQDATNPLSKKKQVFVPYRDSVLTWLLKDSLGGNSKTIMIATISPADVNYGETLSTLRYANRAKNIINKPTINEDPNVKLIRELRAEIARLKALLAQGNQIALLDSPTALSMEEKLQQNEARVQELTKEWTNKWNETQDILKEQTLALRKEGIGVVLDSELPHLIGIDDDLLSTGIILYHLKEGQTYVGREDAMTEQDIVLHGLDLESEHCIFENLNGTVNLIPLNGAQCSVNGIQVTEATHLNQGAVILLGRTNMFRFNHPKEAAKLREKRKSGLLSSFSLSMTDLSKSCENLSAVMLYNPGLEFERQQREELEKLESKSLDQEIQQLKQKIYEGDGGQKGNHGTLEERLSHMASPTSPTKPQPPAAPLVDDRINAFIEQEVQRRLQNIHHKAEENDVSLSWSTESLKDNERLNNGTVQRKLKYEKSQQWQPPDGFPFMCKDGSCASELCGENAEVRGHKRQKEYTEMWDLFSSSGRISSPFTSEKALENERSNSDQESFACRCDIESSLIHSKNTNTLKSKNVPFQNVLSTSLRSHDLNNVAYSLCKVKNFNHFDNKIMTSQDCDSSRTESDCSHLKQLSPVGSLMGANEQDGFNNTSCLLFSQSNVHSEIITCKENSPFNTLHLTIEDQSSNSQLPTQKASGLISFKSIASHSDASPEHTYGLGYLFSKLSCLYKDTSSHLLNTMVFSKQIKELGSLCDGNEKYAQAVSLIKNLPFVRNLQVNVFFKSDMNQDMTHPTDDAKAHTENVIQPESPVQEAITMCVSPGISDAYARKPSEGFACCCKKEELENNLVLRQKFVHFPDIFLKLQLCSLERVLEFLTRALPQICVRMEELKGIYWVAVGNCKKPDPQPACLLLFSSILYVVVSSVEQDVCQSSLAVFHEVPIITIKEIQVGFAGQNISLLCSAEDGLLTIFTYNKHFTQRICHDIMSILISTTDDAVYLNHQLLKDDLMQISLDWTSEVDDLVLSNGIRLSCKFRTELADLVYLLHENMGGIKPSLGDTHVLLYTSVKVDCAKQTVYRALVLTTTHIGLLRECIVFYPATYFFDASCQQLQSDSLQLYSLNDIRCVVLPDKENFTQIELVFSRRSKVGSDSGIGFSKYCEKGINTQLTVIPSILQSSLHIPSEIWKLTFSSSEEAIWLIMHLTRC